jgi:DNA-binding NarL/FixJ family response regulator
MNTNFAHPWRPAHPRSGDASPLTLTLTADDTDAAEDAAAFLSTVKGVRLVAWADRGDARVAVVFADAAGDQALRLVGEAAGDPGRPVLLVVGSIDEDTLWRAVSLGVTGVLLRDRLRPAQLVQAVWSALRGEPPMSPSLVYTLLERMRAVQEQCARAAGLSPREVSVLRMLAEGMTTSEVARRLNYSERTIKNVLHDVITRFGLRNRTQAVAYAIRSGVV